MRVRSYAGLEGAFSIRVCARCAHPDCASACPTGALITAPGGGVRLDKDLCISCKTCVKACAISALQWDEEEKQPLPCIHCGQCVRYCPNDVLALVEDGGTEATPS
jgi:Fe-S-cluster-containing dehydrogenase component